MNIFEGFTLAFT